MENLIVERYYFHELKIIFLFQLVSESWNKISSKSCFM
jgi:hypothetical protein